MDVIWNRYYGLVEKLMLFTGMWPYLESKTRRLRIGLMTMTAGTIFVPQIKYLTESLLIHWRKLETDEEVEIAQSHARLSKRFSVLYSSYCFFGVYGMTSVPLLMPILDIVLPLNESRPVLLPISVYYFMDPRQNLIFVCGFAMVSCGILMTALVAHDCIFVTLVEHVCCMFSVLGSRYEYLLGANFDNTEKNAKLDFDKIYRQKIGQFVCTHNKILEFVKLIENTFTIPLAIQLMILIVSLSCTLLQITHEEARAIDVTRYIFYVTGQLFHLFCLSFEGQKLIDYSLGLRDKIYNSSWYQTSIRSQKLLIMTMMQSLQPTFVSAGKIYIFSLESFTMVVQTSVSYFTVLSTFR
ncbi:odorant receptor 13a-like [Odontomachus brunneus]|uniref:odorant receptor 13a-like n=1 Tax=Odontomachus brunneus TaxID=486640 RepID=UPI0013F1FF79|nr:odorant receptor 13a-like [Odontomachus brunneus]